MATMTSRFSKEDSQLIADLHRLSKAAPKLVKSSFYSAPAEPTITVRSWKMNEYKYYDIPSPFPTLARGLFTTELPNEDEEGTETEDTTRHRIVIRGYDKFFNVGEVPWTTWSSLEAQTGAPYVLSLKSNGCIIFIAPLTPSKLLITSKHSTGPLPGRPMSHAQAGEKWIRKYLAEKGKTEEQLAATLWENNWTAIAELCDDSFEEHVLAYPPEQTGLHLHGINESTKHFKTLAHAEVDAFAEQWGFIKTVSTVLHSISEVKAFMAEVTKTGKWNDEAVEGFVVRTHVIEPPAGGKAVKSPYSPGSSFFFKVKFDEPYMMYRDWREVTKQLLSATGHLSDVNLPKSKMNRPETRLYVKWVIQQINKDRKPFAEYSKGKGIISTRETFLTWLGTEDGQKALSSEKAGDVDDVKLHGTKIFGKTIIVPVAIPGVGKTTVAMALAHIFGFGHTQSDDVHVKKAAPAFVRNVVNLLNNYDVVIADKNNHLRQHRQSLRDATSKMTPSVRLLCLNWSLDKPLSTIHRICGDRVMHRGDNHQTLRADAAAKMHEDVIWKFITGTEELSEGEVDAIVDMDVEDSLEQSVAKAVDGCVRILGTPRPSQEQIKDALEMAKAYAVKVKKPDEQKKSREKFSPKFFGLSAEVDLDAIGECLESGTDVSKESKIFWAHLKTKGRVTNRPHVTIVHKNSLPGASELWDRCVGLHHMPMPPLFKFRLDNILWNDRVMAVTADDLELDIDAGENTQEGHEFVSKLPHEVRNRLHITIGTRDANVPPVEAKALVEAWQRGDEVQSVKLTQTAKGRVKGFQ